jgi:hypothetical protein
MITWLNKKEILEYTMDDYRRWFNFSLSYISDVMRENFSFFLDNYGKCLRKLYSDSFEIKIQKFWTDSMSIWPYYRILCILRSTYSNKHTKLRILFEDPLKIITSDDNTASHCGMYFPYYDYIIKNIDNMMTFGSKAYIHKTDKLDFDYPKIEHINANPDVIKTMYDTIKYCEGKYYLNDIVYYSQIKLEYRLLNFFCANIGNNMICDDFYRLYNLSSVFCNNRTSKYNNISTLLSKVRNYSKVEHKLSEKFKNVIISNCDNICPDKLDEINNWIDNNNYVQIKKYVSDNYYQAQNPNLIEIYSNKSIHVKIFSSFIIIDRYMIDRISNFFILHKSHIKKYDTVLHNMFFQKKLPITKSWSNYQYLSENIKAYYSMCGQEINIVSIYDKIRKLDVSGNIFVNLHDINHCLNILSKCKKNIDITMDKLEHLLQDNNCDKNKSTSDNHKTNQDNKFKRSLGDDNFIKKLDFVVVGNHDASVKPNKQSNTVEPIMHHKRHQNKDTISESATVFEPVRYDNKRETRELARIKNPVEYEKHDLFKPVNLVSIQREKINVFSNPTKIDDSVQPYPNGIFPFDHHILPNYLHSLMQVRTQTQAQTQAQTQTQTHKKFVENSCDTNKIMLGKRNHQTFCNVEDISECNEILEQYQKKKILLNSDCIPKFYSNT